MKTIKIGLAALAFTIAGAGVFANSLLVTTFYRASTPGPNGTGCVALNPQPTGCNGSSSIKCTVVISGQTYNVTKIVDSNPCEQAFKP